MSTQRQKSDFEAINWAWGITRDLGDPKNTDEYWDNLRKTISEKAHDKNTFYRHLGMAIINTMEERMK